MVKICKTCKIIRPLRAFHCNECGACIENHDHHCPWVGNCVGRRNHFFFVRFLTWLCVLCAYLAVCTAVKVFRKLNSPFDKENTLTMDYVILAFSGFTFLSMLPFALFHYWLMGKGLTTNEFQRNKLQIFKGKNPFSNGSWRKNYRYEKLPLPSRLLNPGYYEQNIPRDAYNCEFAFSMRQTNKSAHSSYRSVGGASFTVNSQTGVNTIFNQNLRRNV